MEYRVKYTLRINVKCEYKEKNMVLLFAVVLHIFVRVSLSHKDISSVNVGFLF